VFPDGSALLERRSPDESIAALRKHLALDDKGIFDMLPVAYKTNFVIDIVYH
jgi:hypothetical protein